MLANANKNEKIKEIMKEDKFKTITNMMVNEIKSIEDKNIEDKDIEMLKYNIETLQKKNNELIKQIEYKKDEFGNVTRKFSVSKKVHGFSGILLDNKKIMLTFHTSQNQSPVWSIPSNNICINEELNPIKYVNKPFIIDAGDFKHYFKIYHPEEMLGNLRYGKNEQEDMAHCAFRALWRSISQSNVVTEVEFKKTSNEEFIEVVQNRGFNVNFDNSVWTPAEINETKVDLSTQLYNNIIELEKKEEMRGELITYAIGNYNEIHK